MKITRFKDIPQFTREGSYQVDMDIRRIPEWIKVVHLIQTKRLNELRR